MLQGEERLRALPFVLGFLDLLNFGHWLGDGNGLGGLASNGKHFLVHLLPLLTLAVDADTDRKDRSFSIDLGTNHCRESAIATGLLEGAKDTAEAAELSLFFLA